MKRVPPPPFSKAMTIRAPGNSIPKAPVKVIPMPPI